MKSSVTSGARLVSAREKPPVNLEEFLRELGAGDVRFRGTSFGRGECDLKSFLQQCCDEEDPVKVSVGFVPQTTFWLVSGSDHVVGCVRVRHRLSERLLQHGGHIGYYIRPSERNQGYAKEALRLGLEQLRRIGADRALVTAHPTNEFSRRVILANGGVADGQGKNPDTGDPVDRFWIQL